MSGAKRTVLIVGVGNELLGDEGFGVHVAQLLQAAPALPAHVEVLEAGTALLDVVQEMSRYFHVFIVDAVRAGREPGTLYRVDLTGAGSQQPSAPFMSLHEWGVMETLLVAEKLGLLPERVTLIGAEPENVEPGMTLSPRLAQAAEEVVSRLWEEVLSP